MCLLVACVYLVQQVRKAREQFQKFEKLFRTLREANTKARFMAVSVKDKVSLFETTSHTSDANPSYNLHDI